MGTVISFDQHRAARDRALLERAATISPAHPALRWAAGTDHHTAHRRDPFGDATCGAFGDLTLAPPTAALCPNCYPTAPTRARDEPDTCA